MSETHNAHGYAVLQTALMLHITINATTRINIDVSHLRLTVDECRCAKCQTMNVDAPKRISNDTRSGQLFKNPMADAMVHN